MTDLREAVEAGQQLAERRAKDGMADLALFMHQVRFVESQKDEAWLLGANRSGKSEAGAYVVGSMARFGVLDAHEAFTPGYVFSGPKRIWCVSLTAELSRNIFQPKLFQNGCRIDPRPPLIPDSEIASWNITNQTLRLKNGSIIIFKTCEGGRDVFQGADCDLILFDEVPDEDVYKECTLRVGGGRRLLIRGAATILPPVGVAGGISWLFLAKAQPWLQKGQTNDERNAKSPDYDIFTAGMRDNPTILPEEIHRLESIFEPGSPEHMIRIMGMLLPSIGGALCYAPFNRGFHVVDNLAPMVEGQRRPVVAPFLPLCLNVDFNPENGVWTIGQKINKTFRVLDEITLERSDIASMCHEFRSRYPAHQAELWIHGDSTGRRQEGQTGLSSFHMIAQYLAGYPAPIRFRLPSVNPPQRDRVNAVNLQLRPPSGERLIEFSPLCVETMKDAEGSKWNARFQIDKKHGRRSDGMDTVGYWVVYDSPAHAAFRDNGGLKSVRSPSYFQSATHRGPFPSGVTQLHGRRIHG